FNDKDELIIICQVEGEKEKKCNVKLKHDSSMGNGISHLWSVHKITKDGKQPADKQQKLDINGWWILIGSDKIVTDILRLEHYFTDINLVRTVDAFGEVSELEKNREINTPINTHNILDQHHQKLFWLPFLIHVLKKLQSFTPDQKQVAENELQNKYNEIKSNQPSTASSLPPASSQRKKRSLFDAFTKPLITENEIGDYLALEEIPFEKDPYAWWNEKKREISSFKPII
ncbi:20239_t:CDS:2, partial [Rhizophagus irregularis]